MNDTEELYKKFVLQMVSIYSDQLDENEKTEEHEFSEIAQTYMEAMIYSVGTFIGRCSSQSNIENTTEQSITFLKNAIDIGSKSINEIAISDDLSTMEIKGNC